jgi:hypothetical protein
MPPQLERAFVQVLVAACEIFNGYRQRITSRKADLKVRRYVYLPRADLNVGPYVCLAKADLKVRRYDRLRNGRSREIPP